MWPNFTDGDSIECQKFDDQNIELEDIIVFNHPFKSSLILVKRVKKINHNGELWVVGDNPDPTSSEDSHNFGFVSKSQVIALCK